METSPAPSAHWFLRHDGPTLAVAGAIYGGWFVLMRYHHELPWWVIMAAGAYLIAWHSSLQHEAIHSLRGVPAWVRRAIAAPPLGLWFPYSIYHRSHRAHHHHRDLTDPDRDTESYFVAAADWQRMGRCRRAVLLFNQTLIGRLSIGPCLGVWKTAAKETARIRGGDYSHVAAWIAHATAVAALLWCVSRLCGMAPSEYLLLIAYPGMSLGMLRAFTEHRPGANPAQRTAAVESNPVLGTLFLYNNLHIVHHLQPTLPWYRLPAFYRQHRDSLLALNGGFVFNGYTEIARRYLFRPVFHPVHPS